MESCVVNRHEAEDLLAILGRCLPGSGGIDPVGIHPVPGGGNNRLFRVETPCGPAVLKRYFRHPGDSRNRLDSEYRFSEFLWGHGVRCIPEPLARDDETGTGLYRYVEGVAIRPTEVTGRHLREAQSFFRRANGWRSDPAVQALPDASEACFSMQQHLDLVEQRVRRLADSPSEDGIRGEAVAFVREHLVPAWDVVRRACLRQVSGGGHSLGEPLAFVDRVLSPSDFGFHNALQTAQGLVFHDFEYAGWDDPAKTVCDFFCQVAVPVPMRNWEKVSRECAELAGSPGTSLLRMRWLLPVYRIKWVCIALNHFLAVDGERRNFATGNGETHLATQLGLAGRMLSSIHAGKGSDRWPI